MKKTRLAAVALGVLSLTPAAALADATLAGPPPLHPHLSPRLDELARAPLSTAPVATQADAVSVAPSGPGSLVRRGGKLVVTIRYATNPSDHVDDLKAAGADVLDVSDQYGKVTAAVDETDLAAVSETPGVKSVLEVPAPFVDGQGGGGPLARISAACGSKTSEGDTQLKASLARSHYGIDGTGVTVGVMSDSYDKRAAAPHAAQDVASGDLPGTGNACNTTPVNVVDDSLGAGSATDEGRAMLQIVNDLAPGAKLAFATGTTSESAFINNIGALVTAGAKVIVDDIIWFDEPFFQEGPIAQAANNANAAGVNYFASEGNFNQVSSGQNIGSFESPAYRPGACGIVSANDCEDFDPTAGVDPGLGVTIPTGGQITVILQWAQPWYGVTNDIDLFLTNQANTAKLASGAQPALSTQEPFQFVQYLNTSGAPLPVNVLLEKGNANATNPRFKIIMVNISQSDYPTSNAGDIVGPTAFGHATATGASGVAAVRFDNPNSVESFSSRGNVVNYFGPVSGTTPAGALGTPQTRATPDISATDGGANTFFGQQGYGGVGDTTWRFFGTSAAAPHAAAVAALERQSRPGATPAQIRASQASTATQVGTATSTAEGAGLLNADSAVGALIATAVRWRGATARVAHGAVRVAWKTGYEPGQLGFEVLRARDGRAARVKVSNRLIPGGALGSTDGSYTLSDPHGHAGDRYFVIERSVRGGRKVHGPIVAR